MSALRAFALSTMMGACDRGDHPPTRTPEFGPVESHARSASAAPLPEASRVGVGVSSATASGPTSSTEVLAPGPNAARTERLRADVAKIAVVRPPESPGHRSVASHIEAELRSAGLSPTIEPFSGGRNVVATLPGRSRGEGVIVLSAHYDHIPGCEGADDNASGVAVLLEVARALGKRDTPLSRSVVFASWDAEETGLLGSDAWASGAAKSGMPIDLMISLDAVGYADERPHSQRLPPAVPRVLPEMADRVAKLGRRGNFIVAIGDAGPTRALTDFESVGAAYKLPAFGVALAPMTRLMLLDAARSDHASFWVKGFPGVLITDTADFRNPTYHCGAGPDRPERLDYAFMGKVTSVVETTIIRAADR